MSQDSIISWDEWEAKYKPIQNPNQNGYNGNLWDCMFETFGSDLEYLKELALTNSYYWTVVDNNPNSVYLDIVSGVHSFNRMGYFVTEVPWTDEVTVSNDPSYREGSAA